MKETPWMPQDAVNFLGDIIRELPSPVRVLEFGAGRSTIWFDKMDCRVVSIEHDMTWLQRVRKHTTWRTYLIHHLIPYVGVCDLFKDGLFDIVVVDGRRRVSCVEASMRLVAEDGWLILDDANRQKYGRAHTLLHGWEKMRKTSTDTNLQMVRNAPKKVRTTCFFRRPK